MIRSGVVVEKENGVLGVVFERPEMCAHCGGCLHKHCSRVQIKGDAQIGDTVDVDMPDGEVVKASALMYIVPVCAFLLGDRKSTRLNFSHITRSRMPSSA